MSFRYPLTLRFKLITLSSELSVSDATGTELYFVHQQLLRIREHVDVYRSKEKNELQFSIRADRIIDFGARYTITDSTGNSIGSLHQQGMTSLFQATYDVRGQDDNQSFRIIEANPWVKVLDALLSAIPFVDLITGFILHPKYHLVRPDTDAPILVLTKQAGFFESVFKLDITEELAHDDEQLAILSILMMVLLERSRG